ncbi:MAG: DUF4258 domain-containing protein [Cytophagales bacterium]|nr:MAG: DUF4258 domain-containing protein [Cytophagales bacterium]
MKHLEYKLSKHVIERATERAITELMIREILSNPDQIVDDKTGEEGQKVFQSIINFPENSTYLVRVFVNTLKDPNVVKSVYKTLKISKYYESEL